MNSRKKLLRLLMQFRARRKVKMNMGLTRVRCKIRVIQIRCIFLSIGPEHMLRICRRSNGKSLRNKGKRIPMIKFLMTMLDKAQIHMLLQSKAKCMTNYKIWEKGKTRYSKAKNRHRPQRLHGRASNPPPTSPVASKWISLLSKIRQDNMSWTTRTARL